MLSRSLILAALIALPLLQPQSALSETGHGHGGHEHGASYSAGEPGDSRKPARVVHVTMRETADGKMIYVPAAVQVKRGEQIRFVLTNAGDVPHEFVLASTEDNLKHARAMQNNPAMTHDEPNGRMLEPKAKAELVWRFGKAGTFEFACLIPGHREAGMTGTVTVR
jgi:uncharacterized cupredoxin-like copper-binding protein